MSVQNDMLGNDNRAVDGLHSDKALVIASRARRNYQRHCANKQSLEFTHMTPNVEGSRHSSHLSARTPAVVDPKGKNHGYPSNVRMGSFQASYLTGRSGRKTANAALLKSVKTETGHSPQPQDTQRNVGG